MSDLKHQGVLIFMNGKKHLVPTLSVKQFNQHYTLLTEPVGDPSEVDLKDMMTRNLPMILDAMRRNYPEINTENLTDWLDLSNFKEVMLAVQGTSSRPIVEPDELPTAPVQ